MGPEYAEISGRVLQILLLGQVVAIANYTSGGIAYGLGKHRPVALWAAAEAAGNLILSILLVRRFGIEGVAWGTVVASLVIHLVFWPRYVCRVVEVPIRHYLWQSWVRPILPAIPFGLVCYLADRFWVTDSLVQFFLQMVGLLPVFLLGAAVCFWKEVAWQWRSRAGSIAPTV
jgi:O-antigen/teichoic acid export membrane protein